MRDPASSGDRPDKELGCRFFSFLTAVDWKEQGLEVVAKVDNLDDNVALLLKTRLGPGVSSCASLTPVYRGANWMERECFDMFGIHFDGHPDLRRILLADTWEGHPLLKSYPANKTQPLVAYRTEEEAGVPLEKLAPFGDDEGMSFGRKDPPSKEMS